MHDCDLPEDFYGRDRLQPLSATAAEVLNFVNRTMTFQIEQLGVAGLTDPDGNRYEQQENALWIKNIFPAFDGRHLHWLYEAHTSYVARDRELNRRAVHAIFESGITDRFTPAQCEIFKSFCLKLNQKSIP